MQSATDGKGMTKSEPLSKENQITYPKFTKPKTVQATLRQTSHGTKTRKHPKTRPCSTHQYFKQRREHF
ncbi:hypothetical protein [Candidatus Nitrosotalea sp. TS]|uniref:hypothetical protein n=1 Tax=Candidatus Nitrosotalea sp. TS TaxID=2341020 RepID=UPI001C49C617|nr:hypothetical protein [Candidatus Nitrosotalea sp. TS]